jgi:hypothetical protein
VPASVRRRVLPAVVVVLLALVSPAPAAAAPEDPAVDQYVERVPGPGGDARAERPARRSQLPARVRRQLEREGAEDAEALEALAESPALGAPPAGRGAAPGRPDAREEPGEPRTEADRPSTLEAVASGPAPGDSGAIALLAVGMVAVAAAAIAAALRRRRDAR